MRIGILIIGSLYWEQTEDRRNWRDNRLDVAAKCRVRVPIRYGRRSRTRGCSFTMVFSPGLSEEAYGHAIVAPCKSEELVGEAEWLWAAERNKGRPKIKYRPTGAASLSWRTQNVGCRKTCKTSGPDVYPASRATAGCSTLRLAKKHLRARQVA